MTDTLDERPPPPGLFGLGIVEEQEGLVDGEFVEVREPRRRWWRREKPDPSVPVPPLSPRAKLFQGVLALIAILAGTFVLDMLVISSLQQRSAQQELFDSFREQLAKGTAPIGPNQPVTENTESSTPTLPTPTATSATGGAASPSTTVPEEPQEVLLAPGSPVAYIEIPAIGVSQVVVEGTTSGQLFAGPGHRRDSPLPGQEGTTIIMGRKASYGGPFSQIAELEEGDVIRATTGQGVWDYEVIGVRREGDPVPEPGEAGSGRMLLMTADGPAFFPDGVLRVDAELTGDAVGAPERPFTADTLPAAEKPMASDTSTLYALVLWLQALVLVMVGAVWTWQKLGRAKAWIIFLPPMALVSLFVAGQAARLLPNLL
ncbi:MAG: class E sortase [Acidimicrobiales bacterium]|jgi:hypothetical protein|nr:class E sortase [Acidimicrobiales bacterium]